MLQVFQVIQIQMEAIRHDAELARQAVEAGGAVLSQVIQPKNGYREPGIKLSDPQGDCAQVRGGYRNDPAFPAGLFHDQFDDAPVG